MAVEHELLLRSTSRLARAGQSAIARPESRSKK